MHSEKIKDSNDFIVEGIEILDNKEHLEKAPLPIEVTDEGTETVDNEHLENAKFPIEVTDDGIEIFVNNEQPLNA